MAAKLDAYPPPDAFTTFIHQVASELRQLQEPANLTRLKRKIVNMILKTLKGIDPSPCIIHIPTHHSTSTTNTVPSSVQIYHDVPKCHIWVLDLKALLKTQ